MSETEMKLFQQLKEFGNFFKIISATSNIFESIYELQLSLWNNLEITSGKFPHGEIKLFQTDLDERWKIL